MPLTCCAYGCKNRSNTGDNRHFFRFPPKNEELLKRWIAATRIKDFTPTKFTKICSDHFVESDYLVRPGAYIVRLKPDAVPSVFPGFPPNLQNVKSLKRILKRNILKPGLELIQPSPEKCCKIEKSVTPINKSELKLSLDELDRTSSEKSSKIDLCADPLDRPELELSPDESVLPFSTVNHNKIDPPAALLNNPEVELSSDESVLSFTEKFNKINNSGASIKKPKSKLTPEIEFISLPSTSTNIETSPSETSRPIEIILRRKIKTLNQKLHRRNLKILELKLIIQELNRNRELERKKSAPTYVYLVKGKRRNSDFIFHNKNVKDYLLYLLIRVFPFSSIPNDKNNTIEKVYKHLNKTA